jgi:hypothetical protein
MAQRSLTEDEALRCSKCGKRAHYFQSYCNDLYEEDEIIIIVCTVQGCNQSQFFYCRSCKRKNNATIKALRTHANTKFHITKHNEKYQSVQPVVATLQQASPLQGHDDVPPFPDSNDNDVEDFQLIEGMDEENFDQDLSNTFIQDATGPMLVGTNSENKSNEEICQFANISMEGNEWLAEALKDTKYATYQSFVDR